MILQSGMMDDVLIDGLTGILLNPLSERHQQLDHMLAGGGR
jgi:hypothetical protein